MGLVGSAFQGGKVFAAVELGSLSVVVYCRGRESMVLTPVLPESAPSEVDCKIQVTITVGAKLYSLITSLSLQLNNLLYLLLFGNHLAVQLEDCTEYISVDSGRTGLSRKSSIICW